MASSAGPVEVVEEVLPGEKAPVDTAEKENGVSPKKRKLEEELADVEVESKKAKNDEVVEEPQANESDVVENEPEKDEEAKDETSDDLRVFAVNVLKDILLKKTLSVEKAELIADILYKTKSGNSVFLEAVYTVAYKISADTDYGKAIADSFTEDFDLKLESVAEDITKKITAHVATILDEGVGSVFNISFLEASV